MTHPFSYIRRVFVDSSAYFVLANRHDIDHAGVVAIVERLASARVRLFTSNFVMAETHALLLSRLNRQIAAAVLLQIDESRLTVRVRISLRDELRAREIIGQYYDNDFSLTDATSFAVMERLRIQHVLTLDHNFAQFGWTMLYQSS